MFQLIQENWQLVLAGTTSALIIVYLVRIIVKKNRLIEAYRDVQWSGNFDAMIGTTPFGPRAEYSIFPCFSGDLKPWKDTYITAIRLNRARPGFLPRVRVFSSSGKEWMYTCRQSPTFTANEGYTEFILHEPITSDDEGVVIEITYNVSETPLITRIIWQDSIRNLEVGFPQIYHSIFGVHKDHATR